MVTYVVGSWQAGAAPSGTPVMLMPFSRDSDVTCNPADAAHADVAVSATQWWTAQTSSGRGSG